MQIVFHGKRWFSDYSGNSEHSVTVYIDGAEIGYQKGNGGLRMYEQTGKNILKEKGYDPKMIKPLSLVSDVKTKKDL